MRGRYSTWTRIRVNLQNVPEDAAARSGASRPRREDALELVGPGHLELVVAAIAAAACPAASAGRSRRGGSGRPACGRTSPRTRARCAAAPRKGPCRRSSGSARRACGWIRPPAPAQSRQGWSSMAFLRSGSSSFTSCLRIAMVNDEVTPDVLQHALVVVQPEEQRAHGVLAALVPAEAGDHAFGGARMLHLDHRALAGQVGARLGLGDHAVQPRAFEAREPVAAQRRGRASSGVR